MTKKRIPTFHSIEEEAAFWDSHDTTEYEGEFTSVTVRPKKLEHVLPVRFDTQTITELQHQASEKGIGATTLVRMWILERLKGVQKPA